MSHRKASKTDFVKERSVLSYRPKIIYVEPDPIAGEQTAELEDINPPTISEFRAQLEDNIQRVEDIQRLADNLQIQLDKRSDNLEINLDEQQDAYIIDALQRHRGQSKTKANVITYDDYKKCLLDINIHSFDNLPKIEEKDIQQAFLDPARTNFGYLGKPNGLARPELDLKLQAIKPLDIAKFKKRQLYLLSIELLNIILDNSGPLGVIQKRLLRRVLKALKRRLKKLKEQKVKRINIKNFKNTDETDIQAIENTVELLEAKTNAIEDNSEVTEETSIQDCNILATAYERGAHFSATESSVFAPLSRSVQTNKIFSKGVGHILASYRDQINTKEEKRTERLNVAFDKFDVSVPDFSEISNTGIKKLKQILNECIPCDFRTGAFFELSPKDTFSTLVTAQLDRIEAAFKALQSLLDSFAIYDEICYAVSFLDTMCIPDLQRMLALLAALLQDNSINLSAAMNLILQLVAPFFLPILMGMIDLLGKYAQLVLEPFACIITSINYELNKLIINPQTNTLFTNINKLAIEDAGADKPLFKLPTLSDPSVQSQNDKLLNTQASLAGFQMKVINDIDNSQSFLVLLSQQLTFGWNLAGTKLTFYTTQLQKLLSEFGFRDDGYIAGSRTKLINIRLIAVISAVIKSKVKGQKLCQNYMDPKDDEIKGFFDNYLAPTAPYVAKTDGKGGIVLEEKPQVYTPGGGSTGGSSGTLSRPDTLAVPESIKNKKIKCLMRTSESDINKVNRWIAELNK